MPEGNMMTMAFAIGLSIKDLKRHFANQLKVPSEVIQISLEGKLSVVAYIQHSAAARF